jgi:hypothetical protein
MSAKSSGCSAQYAGNSVSDTGERMTEGESKRGQASGAERSGAERVVVGERAQTRAAMARWDPEAKPWCEPCDGTWNGDVDEQQRESACQPWHRGGAAWPRKLDLQGGAVIELRSPVMWARLLMKLAHPAFWSWGTSAPFEPIAEERRACLDRRGWSVMVACQVGATWRADEWQMLLFGGFR